MPDYTQLKNYEPAVMTRVHASDGSVLAEYAHERRLYLPSTSIPPLVKEAFISAEDKNFYTHHGVDVEGIGRALLVLVGRRPARAGRLHHHAAGREKLPARRTNAPSSAKFAKRCCRCASKALIRRKRSSNSI